MVAPIYDARPVYPDLKCAAMAESAASSGIECPAAETFDADADDEQTTEEESSGSYFSCDEDAIRDDAMAVAQCIYTILQYQELFLRPIPGIGSYFVISDSPIGQKFARDFPDVAVFQGRSETYYEVTQPQRLAYESELIDDFRNGNRELYEAAKAHFDAKIEVLAKHQHRKATTVESLLAQKSEFPGYVAECIACTDATPAVLQLPCRHAIMCSACFKQLTNAVCAMCRHDIHYVATVPTTTTNSSPPQL